MSLAVLLPHRYQQPFIERPLSPKPVSWSQLSYNSVKDAFLTLCFFAGNPHEPFLRTAFPSAIKTPTYFDLAIFDQTVGNHFPISSVALSSRQAPRPDSIRFAIFAERVSPIVVLKIKDVLILLDGNHRSLAAAATHSKIAAIVFEISIQSKHARSANAAILTNYQKMRCSPRSLN